MIEAKTYSFQGTVQVIVKDESMLETHGSSLVCAFVSLHESVDGHDVVGVLQTTRNAIRAYEDQTLAHDVEVDGECYMGEKGALIASKIHVVSGPGMNFM